MHLCAVAINRSIFVSNKWPCVNSIDLALHHLNREKEPNDSVLFVSSLFLLQRDNLSPAKCIDGRLPQSCSTVVKCINLKANHWIATVWSRHQSDTTYVLDSLTSNPRTCTKRNRTAAYTAAAQHLSTFASS